VVVRTKKQVNKMIINDRHEREGRTMRKMTIVMLLMCGVVTVGYLPFMVYIVMQVMELPPDIDVERLAAIFLMVNSAVTPLIYPLMIKRVRAAVFAQFGIGKVGKFFGINAVPSTIGIDNTAAKGKIGFVDDTANTTNTKTSTRQRISRISRYFTSSKLSREVNKQGVGGEAELVGFDNKKGTSTRNPLATTQQRGGFISLDDDGNGHGGDEVKPKSLVLSDVPSSDVPPSGL
jgi:hypothetical protein